MAHVRFNYRSEALSKYIDVTVTFPADNYSFYTDDSERKPRISHGKNTRPQYRPGMKFQTVYLIHGGGDDDTTPYRFTNVERYADENNVMLVTPDISNSFGADTEYGMDYELFLTAELPVLIQAIFPSSPRREDNFIVGFAMGGNVALSAALRHPELYSVCVDMSGGIGYTLNTAGFKAEMESDHFRNHFFLHNATFGPADKLEGSKHDLYPIAKALIGSGKPVPKFYILHGSEEGFIGDRVAKDAQIMKELGFPLTYVVEPGGKHDFYLWDKYLRIALSEGLPLTRDPKKV